MNEEKKKKVDRTPYNAGWLVVLSQIAAILFQFFNVLFEFSLYFLI